MESSIEELFNAINNSNEYKEYKQIVDIIEEDNDIKNLIEEIKKLQKEATYLEYHEDNKYKEIDNIIEEKTKELNNNSKYQEYLSKFQKVHQNLMFGNSYLTNLTYPTKIETDLSLSQIL